MRNISTKLLFSIGIVTIIFSIFLFYQTYSLTNRRVREVVEQQASMALKFDLAIRKYVGEKIRPLMYELVGEDEFVPETMSTSYVARTIFDDVRSEFPGYILKFSSENPRNPANQAGPEELKVIDYLNNNPDLNRWEGEILIDGKQYMAKFSARRMKGSCLRCHGDPKDAPASLLKRYGTTAGFHLPIGMIIGSDTVAIPMQKISEQFWSGLMPTFLVSGLSLLLFFWAIIFATRLVITNRVSIISKHFVNVAQQEDYSNINPIDIKGRDEISDLAISFNVLIDKLKKYYTSLEKQVKERTIKLEDTNEQLRKEIGERKRAEEALRESEEKYRNLFNNAQVGLYRTRISDGKFIEANDALARMFGYEDRADILDGEYITADNYVDPDTREKLLAILRKHGEFKNFEARLYRKEGPAVWFRYSGRIYPEKGYIEGVAADITEEKRLGKRLLQSQKMEAVGTLAGGVAHDLNNILSGLVSYPELLLMDIPEDSPLRKPIMVIQDSGQKAAVIVQDLLTLARRGVAITEVVNLNDIIQYHLASPEHEKLKSFHPDVKFEVNLASDLLNTLGSTVHLSKTIMNLLSNAAEAMPDAGAVAISTSNQYLDRPVRGYEDVQDGDYIVLSVVDSGIGMSEKDLARIFEPFYTKKVMGRSGTGLGMAVVWGTVKDHHGYIDVQSKEGEGTSFTLYFPVTRKERAKDISSLPIEEYTGNEESILVVDDVKEQREIASEMLIKMGYSVISVSSGEEAVEYMKNNTADLIVLDMIMDPGINGRETYEMIINLHPDQKAIIASGFSESEDVKAAQKLGAGQYIKKPYTLEKIGIAVRDELNK